VRQYIFIKRSLDLCKVFDIERPEVVSHYAAQKSVPFSIQDPIEDCDVNICGFLNLLKVSMQYGIRKFINISSG
jgi:UDP-glucose 4-epimerase